MMQKSIVKISNGLLEVIENIPEQFYTQPIPVLENKTIGMQVRHVIEHWQILFDNYENGIINYGDRNRDKSIETQKSIARSIIQQLQVRSNKVDKQLQIVSVDDNACFNSTYYREIDVVTEHIIHHAAIIKVAVLSIEPAFVFPPEFGYAPATISYKEQCVQ